MGDQQTVRLHHCKEIIYTVLGWRLWLHNQIKVIKAVGCSTGFAELSKDGAGLGLIPMHWDQSRRPSWNSIPITLHCNALLPFSPGGFYSSPSLQPKPSCSAPHPTSPCSAAAGTQLTFSPAQQPWGAHPNPAQQSCVRRALPQTTALTTRVACHSPMGFLAEAMLESHTANKHSASSLL